MSDAGYRRLCSALVLVLGLGVLVVAGTSGEKGAEVPQILLVIIDTLRADHLGMYGYERDTSPLLDAWAERGRVYEHGMATSPWTLPSFASIYTGHPVMRHGAGLENDLYVPIDETVPTLAELGYDTQVSVWFGFFAPAAVPGDIIAKLSAACEQAVATDSFKENMAGANRLVRYMSTDAFGPFFKEAFDLNGQLLKEAGLIK